MVTETAASWQLHYDKGVPRSLEYPEVTLLDLLRDASEKFPDRTAFTFKGNAISYAGLDSLSRAMAVSLVELGVKPGDRVALILPNSPQAIICLFGAWAAGAIAVPVNPLNTEGELDVALREVESDVAIVLTPFYRKLKAIQRHAGVRRVIATNIKEFLPRSMRVLFTLFKDWKEGHSIELDLGDLWLQPLIERHMLDLPPAVDVLPDNDAVILFTGGTTGTPKGAVGTHRSLVTSGMQLRAWFSSTLVPWDDTIMMSIPLFHVMGMNGVLASAIVNHNPLCLVPDPRDIGDVIATIATAKPALLPGVPTLYSAMLNDPAVKSGKADLSSLKLCVSGAELLTTETKLRFETLTGARIVEGYALTESMLASVMTPVAGRYKPGSVGVPLPDVEIRIADSEYAEVEVLRGDVGEVLMRAPQLMRCYWRRKHEPEGMIRGGWLHTGDLGYLDEDGYLYLVDRKKDVIKTSGLQVWPHEIEELLATHPAVSEAGVAGVPDQDEGEAVKAWVVLRQGSPATAEELKAFCRERLAPYKVPKEIELRSELPKSVVGKILRRMLRQEGA